VHFDKVHQTLDNKKADYKRGNHADAKKHKLIALNIALELNDLKKACAEHDWNRKEERELGSSLTLDTQGRLPSLDGILFSIPCPF
jgi:hypothetical protein